MTKYLLVLLILLNITGCSSIPSSTPSTLGGRSVSIDPKLLQACPLLTVSNNTDPSTVLLDYLDLFKQYGICASMQDTSINALKLIGENK